MKKTYLLSLTLLLLALSASAQEGVEQALLSIQRNHPTLAALRLEAEADKLGARADLLWDPLEAEWAHLNGHSGSAEYRREISLSQRIDLASLLLVKRRVGEGRSAAIEGSYLARRMELLLEAQQVCIDLVHANALVALLAERQEQAKQLQHAWEAKMRQGDATQKELNDLSLTLVTAKGDYLRACTEQERLQRRLVALNGGHSLALTSTQQEVRLLPEEVESLIETLRNAHPALQQARRERLLKEREFTLAKTELLPSLSVGFVDAHEGGEKFRGLSVGVAIPLWSAPNHVRHARVQRDAARAREEAMQHELQSSLTSLWHEVREHQQLVADYRRALASADNLPLLRRSLEAGQITLIEYLASTALYYDTRQQALQAERDLAALSATLHAPWL